jgi:uncharacterized protein with PIN domain
MNKILLQRWVAVLFSGEIQDTKYSSKLSDLDLILKAKEEERILLTKDINLYRQAIKNKIQVFFIKTQNKAEILGKLRNSFGIPLIIDMKISRCPLCNSKIQTITKQEAAKIIKQKTLLHYNYFWSCPKCMSIYWQGSHWKDIKSTLDKAKNSFRL